MTAEPNVDIPAYLDLIPPPLLAALQEGAVPVEGVPGMSIARGQQTAFPHLETTEALRDALREVLGDDVSARCRPAGYSGSVAILACRSNASAQVVAMHLPRILEQLRQRLSHADVTELRLAIAPERWASP